MLLTNHSNTDIIKSNILGLDNLALECYFSDLGQKKFRAKQLLQWVHQKYITDFNEMLNMPVALREKLSLEAQLLAPEITTEQISTDGTHKWLLSVSGNNNIETVYIPEGKRGTLCISSQVGCMLNCKFCSTATQGFNRNLTSSEIIGQLWRANVRLRDKINQKLLPPISNVVMMGMGEPLLNFDAVTTALKLMLDDNAYGLAKKRVTVSTSGVVPQIINLSSKCSVALAISLHAPNDALRSEIVPLNKKYPLAVLLDACKQYSNANKMKITMEYVMLEGVNDSSKHAKELIKLLTGIACKVNLIPFNPFIGSKYKCSSMTVISNFQSILQQAGIITTIRKPRGRDIDAACGQLRGKVLDKTYRQQRFNKLYSVSHNGTEQAIQSS